MKKTICLAAVTVLSAAVLTACGLSDSIGSALEHIGLEEDYDDDTDSETLSEDIEKTIEYDTPLDAIKAMVVDPEEVRNNDAVYLAPAKMDDGSYTLIDEEGNIYDHNIKEHYMCAFNKYGTILCNVGTDNNPCWEYKHFLTKSNFNHYSIFGHGYDQMPGSSEWTAIGKNGYYGARCIYGDKEGLWGFKNRDHETTPTYYAAGSFGDFDYAPVLVPFARWGYVDIRGNFLGLPEYTYASDFSDGGYAVVRDSDGSYHYFDLEGNITLNLPNFENSSQTVKNILYPTHNGYGTWFHRDSKDQEHDGWYVINPSGDVFSGPYADLSIADELGLFYYKLEDFTDYQSFTNARAELVIQAPDTFIQTSGFNKFGVACLSTEPVTTQFGGSENAYNCVIDLDGNYVVEPGRYDLITPYGENGLAPVCIRDENSEDIEGRWGYVNTKGEEVIAPQFRDAKAFAAVVMPEED